MANRINKGDVLVEQFSIMCPDCEDNGLIGDQCLSATFGATCDCHTATCDSCGKTWTIPQTIRNIGAWQSRSMRQR